MPKPRGRAPTEDPAVKGRTVTRFEQIPPEPEVRALREKLGFDYGKFDFVVHGGRPVILDVNKTQGPGLLHIPEYDATNARRARGIYDYLPSDTP